MDSTGNGRRRRWRDRAAGAGGALSRVLVAVALAVGLMPALAAPQGEAHAADTNYSISKHNASENTIGDDLGMTRSQLVKWLRKHMNDSYYLGTPYRGHDHRNPNGDHAGANGSDDTAGVAAMNCNGFVWHALWKASGKTFAEAYAQIPCWTGQGAGGIAANWKDNYYISVKGDSWADVRAGLKELVDDGDMREGDVVWFIDANAKDANGNYVGEGGWHLVASSYHHIGFYIGDDDTFTEASSAYKESTASWNRFWHSSDNVSVNSITGGNAISTLQPKTTCLAAVVIPIDHTGSLTLKKASANKSVTKGNPCYSLEGAKYGVYDSKADAEANSDKLGTLTVKSDGTSNTLEGLSAGTYWVKETKAPKGYILDKSPHKVTVTAGETTTFEVEDEPVGDPDEAFKRDPSTGRAVAQGAATVQGAEFTFRYYAGYYDAGNLPASPTRTWVLKTNANGLARLVDGDILKVSGDDFYRDETGNITSPLGTLTVTETKAPEGYLLGYYDQAGAFHAPATFVTQLRQHATGSNEVDHVAMNYTQAGGAAPVDDTVKRGNVKGVKRDSKTADGMAQGAATIAGAKIEVVNRTGGVVVSPEDGREAADGEVVCTLTTGEDGEYSTTAADLNGWSIPADWAGKALPVGNYLLREASPSEGYNLNASWTADVTVSEDGQEIDAGTLPEDVIRGDIELTKKAEAGSKPLAGVPFVITSKTTGEAHVVVTDDNGMVSTAADFNPHSRDTNANDAALAAGEGGDEGGDGEYADDVEGEDADGAGDGYEGDDLDEEGEYADGAGDGYEVDEGALDPAAGVWFDGRGDDANGAPVDDALGALPYDTYTVTEVRCSANEGLELVEFDVTISRDSRVIDLGTVTDRPAPSVGTTLTYDGDTHTAVAEEGVPLTDTVAYSNFDAGDYRFAGELHLVGPDGTDKGVVAEAEKEAAVAGSAGTVDVTFTVDASGLPGTGDKLVAFERVYGDGDELVAEHADLDDEGQTVTVAEIGTTLTDKADGDHVADMSGEVTLTDTVAYKGLTPGKRYTMNLTLHKRAADGTDAGVLEDASGKAVTKSLKFTPAAADGTVDVTVTFTPARGTGYDVVAFEELTRGDETYAVHADISDEGQTVRMPGISTTATDKATGTHVGKPTGEDAVVDAVAYGGLTAGGSYVMRGTLANAVTGEAVASAEKAFTASATGSGEVELEFGFDAGAVEGGTVVVLEQLYTDGGKAPVAEHSELADEGQTVRYPALGTTAADGKTGTHEGAAAAEVKIIDTVAYTGLTAGGKYEVRGTVMDKSTGEAYVDASGKAVEATAEFTADKPSGTVDVEFAFDGTALKGATLVVFERAYDADGKLAAEHADLDDEGQTVAYTVPGSSVTTEQGGNPGDGAKWYDRTGDWLRDNWPWLLAAAALAAGGAALWKRGRGRKPAEGAGEGGE